MKFTLVRKIPDAINIEILCWKCGLNNFPDVQHDWWGEGSCCCLYSNCGIKEFLTTQLCILGPCQLDKPASHCTTALPVHYIFFLIFGILL